MRVAMRNWSIPIALSLASAAAAAPPQRVEIGFEIARNGLVVAEVHERLEHDGRRYHLSETWKGKGIFALRGEARRISRGAVGADGLRPLEFEDQRSGRETARARFDWSAKTLTLQYKSEPASRPLPEAALDRLSFLYGFAFRNPGAQAATFNVTDGRSVTTYVYQAAGRERVKTPAGEFDALKLVKRRDHPQDRATEIWLAADRHYLPVRIVLVEKDGTRLETVAVKIATQ